MCCLQLDLSEGLTWDVNTTNDGRIKAICRDPEGQNFSHAFRQCVFTNCGSDASLLSPADVSCTMLNNNLWQLLAHHCDNSAGMCAQ